MRRWILLSLVRYFIEHELTIAREVIGFSIEFDPQEHLCMETGGIEITWRMNPPRVGRNGDLARAYISGDPWKLLPIQERFNLPQLEQLSRDDYKLYQKSLKELEAWERMVIREALDELNRLKKTIRTVAECLGYRVIKVEPAFPEPQPPTTSPS